MVEGIVKKPFHLDDGVHNGTITELEERTDPYNYLDVVIEMADGRRLKVGYPNNIMTESKLGKLLTRFGATLKEGENIQMDAWLCGKQCTFQSITEDKFYKVIGESLKPFVVEETVK